MSRDDAPSNDWGEMEDVALANDFIELADRQAYRAPGEMIAALYALIDEDAPDDDIPTVIVLYESDNRMWYSHTGASTATLLATLARFNYAMVRATFEDDED